MECEHSRTCFFIFLFGASQTTRKCGAFASWLEANAMRKCGAFASWLEAGLVILEMF